MIDSINRAILRNLRSTHTGKGWIEVYNVNDLVADSARWNFSRPSELLTLSGYDRNRIRTERFGATGSGNE